MTKQAVSLASILSETDRGQRSVAMRVVGSALVVELPPAFDEHFGLGAAAEPLVQQFVAQLAVEAFDEPVKLICTSSKLLTQTVTDG